MNKTIHVLPGSARGQILLPIQRFYWNLTSYRGRFKEEILVFVSYYWIKLVWSWGIYECLMINQTVLHKYLMKECSNLYNNNRCMWHRNLNLNFIFWFLWEKTTKKYTISEIVIQNGLLIIFVNLQYWVNSESKGINKSNLVPINQHFMCVRYARLCDCSSKIWY